MSLPFTDDFSTFDTNTWFVYTNGYCYGRTLFGAPSSPTVVTETGTTFLRLRVATYGGGICSNDGKNYPYIGTEIMTNATFGPPGTSVEFEARCRSFSTVSGLVFGFFPYIDSGPPSYLKDELDVEFLGKAPFPYGELWLNSWNDINHVNLVIRRLSDGYYWTGSSWSPTATTLTTTVSGSTWSRSNGNPTGLTTGSTYELTASAYDTAGNARSTINHITIG